MANHLEGEQLVVLDKDEIAEKERCDRLIAELEIPLHQNYEKVMFYDVLIKLCFSRNYLHFYKSNDVLGQVFGRLDSN